MTKIERMLTAVLAAMLPGSVEERRTLLRKLGGGAIDEDEFLEDGEVRDGDLYRISSDDAELAHWADLIRRTLESPGTERILLAEFEDDCGDHAFFFKRPAGIEGSSGDLIHLVAEDPDDVISAEIFEGESVWTWERKDDTECFSEEEYVEWLNELKPDPESAEWIIGGRRRYDEFDGKFGEATRACDPVGFGIGYREKCEQMEYERRYGRRG